MKNNIFSMLNQRIHNVINTVVINAIVVVIIISIIGGGP